LTLKSPSLCQTGLALLSPLVFEENETSSAEISLEMCDRMNFGDIWGNTISLTGSDLESPHFKCKSQQGRA